MLQEIFGPKNDENIDLSQIFKVYFLDSDGNKSRLVIFGNSSELSMDKIFSESEKKSLEEEKITPEYSAQQIHKDDSIRAVKKKIIKEYGTNLLSYEEIYMFSKSKMNINLWNIYQEITPLTSSMIGQLLVNINLPVNKIDELTGIIEEKTNDNISYDDLLRLNIDKEENDLFLPIGMTFAKTHNFLFSANPFDILSDPLYEPSNKNPLLALDNKLLLNERFIRASNESNVIYVSLYGNVLEFAKKRHIDSEYIIRCYYPFLMEKMVLSEEQFLQSQQILIDENKRLLKPQTLKYYDTVDMFYKVYNQRKTELPYSTKGMKNYEIIIHPENKTLLPLDAIFKQIHASKMMPYIKYNPGFRREHLYRLYTEKISKIGKKIPYLSKSQINGLISVTGKSNQISLVVCHKIEDIPIEVFMDIEQNGNIIIRSNNNAEYTEKSKTTAILSIADIKRIIDETVNPVITDINDILEQFGYKLKAFTDFNEETVEIVDMTYQVSLPYKNKISLVENITCTSTIFDIVDDDINKGAILRYKRVENFKKMDALSALITDVFKRTNDEASVINSLMANYGKTEEEALFEVVRYFNEHTRINGKFVNKTVDIAENPGFPTIIRLLPFEKKCLIEISQIKSIEYIDAIGIYLDTFLRFSQVPDEVSADLIKLCKKTKEKEVLDDISHIDNVVAAVEIKPIALKKRANDFFQEEEEPMVPSSISSLINLDNSDETEEDEGILFDEPEEESDEDLEEGILFDEPEEGVDEDSEESRVSKDDNTSPLFGGTKEYIYEPGSLEAEQLLKKWSKKNVLFDKMKKLEPKLFLSSSTGKYSAYTRVCPTNVNRQPVILTNEEKEKIDRDRPGSYTNAIQYGTDEKKKFWYICPRYWCTLTNAPMTEDEVKRGDCGGKIMPQNKEKSPPPGHYIYEFTDNKYHKNTDGSYAYNSPGFTPSDSHPEGYCLPCCFKNWDAASQKLRRQQCAASGKEITMANKDKDGQKLISYIMGVDKFPIPQYRWGFLQIPVELFLHTNNEIAVSKINKNEIEKNKPSLLRYGVEQSQTRSFIGCIADIYAYKKNLEDVPKIDDMLKTISESITLDMYLKYHSGSLVSVFQPKKIEMDDYVLSTYHNTEFYKSLDPAKEAEADFFEDTVASFENFLSFLNNDKSLIDHTYLWDIITSENAKLFGGGLNLVIIELLNDDITNNIRLLCPTNSYSDKFYDMNKETVILIKQDDYYEPVYLYENKDIKNKSGVEENIVVVKKTFSENQTIKPLKDVLIMIEQTMGRYCSVKPSMPDIYKFKSNISAKELYLKLRKIKYSIQSQVMNYRGKIIALMAKKMETKNYEEPDDVGMTSIVSNEPSIYIPCSPSAGLPELNVEYMDSDSLWNSYETTRTLLEKINYESKGEILCLPKIKIIEDGMVIGILTETNQFIQIDPPYLNTEDGLEELDDSNFVLTDKKLILGNSPDKDRIDITQKITLETQFYNAFRSTLRLLLNDMVNRDIRDKIINILDSTTSFYSTKLENMVKLLKYFMRNSVIFNIITPDLLESLRTISTCTSKCESKKYCLVSDGNICKLIIPKMNLLLPTVDNEKKYYYKMADELLRYSRTRLFMLNSKQFLNISNIEYQINNNEFIILHSLLTGNYFDDLIPFQMNEYIESVTYDFANPIISQKYSNNISLVEQNKRNEPSSEFIEDINSKCINETIPIIGNASGYWRKMFPKDARELVFDNTKYCSFYIIIHILKKIYGKNISVQDIKISLWNAYEPYMNSYKKQILRILSKQGKRAIIDKIKQNVVTMEDMIMSEEYYLSNLDLWMFSKKTNIPVVLFTSTMLTDLELDIKWLILGGYKEGGSVDISRPFFFIRSQTGIKEPNYVQEYHLISPSYKLSELSGMVTMTQSADYEKNRLSFDDFLKR